LRQQGRIGMRSPRREPKRPPRLALEASGALFQASGR
jgi:hypothetical protein